MFELNIIILDLHNYKATPEGSGANYNKIQGHDAIYVIGTWSWDDFPWDFRIGFKLFRTPIIGWIMIVVVNWCI